MRFLRRIIAAKGAKDAKLFVRKIPGAYVENRSLFQQPVSYSLVTDDAVGMNEPAISIAVQ
jgi:hypothetical protein